MSEIRDHRDLEAWQVAMNAVTETYRITGSFPKSERRLVGTATAALAALALLRLFS